MSHARLENTQVEYSEKNLAYCNLEFTTIIKCYIIYTPGLCSLNVNLLIYQSIPGKARDYMIKKGERYLLWQTL
jgi:hypothetical protein